MKLRDAGHERTGRESKNRREEKVLRQQETCRCNDMEPASVHFTASDQGEEPL